MFNLIRCPNDQLSLFPAGTIDMEGKTVFVKSVSVERNQWEGEWAP